MHRRQADSPSRLAGEQALDDFRRESRKRRQTTEKTGNGKQFPGERKVRVEVKQTHRDTNQVSTNYIGRQRAERQGKEQWIQRHPQQPARPGAKCSARADGEKV